MTDMTPEQILDGAAEYINEHGWTRGISVDESGRACLLGSIHMAVVPEFGYGCYDETAAARYRAVMADKGPVAVEAIRRCLVNEGIDESPVGWNDHACRDADEAIHMLKKAKEFL